jgi:5-methylcytosine-specific restriction endonuclease McrA
MTDREMYDQLVGRMGKSRAIKWMTVLKGSKNAVHRQRPNHQRIKNARIKETNSTCEACRAKMPSPTLLHLHHITPIAQGGTDTDDNTVLLCPNCHTKAHWLMEHGAEKAECIADMLTQLRGAA